MRLLATIGLLAVLAPALATAAAPDDPESLARGHHGRGAELYAQGKHADAMARHRQHVVESIRELEQKQDELLDKLTSKP